MKKYLLNAVVSSVLLVSCSTSDTNTMSDTSGPTTSVATTAEAQPTSTTVLITTSVVEPPQSGSIVLRPVLRTLKDAASAPAEMAAGTVVLSEESGASYLAGNVLSEGNIFADASVAEQADGSYSLAAVLREGSQGLDVLNIAAAGCAKKDASCPSGILAVVVNGKFVGVVPVRGAFKTTSVAVEGKLSKEAADSYVRLITGQP
jgi:hypothetical protein